MALQITKDDVWAGDLEDQPGGLARVLEPLVEAGANLECVIARRRPEQRGTATIYVTPIKGARAQKAATQAGLERVKDVATLRIEGPDKPGLGARMARTVADAGVNVRGVSAVVIGNKFVAYIGFDSMEDATKAARVLKGIDTARPAARRAAAAAPARRRQGRARPKGRSMAGTR
jgi:hypothetical protein